METEDEQVEKLKGLAKGKTAYPSCHGYNVIGVGGIGGLQLLAPTNRKP